ncbi:MAG: nitrile hydratase [Planktomarina sp.]|jgi:nitrile hydratase|tara:strand:+ start:164 stop:808 length:645 start_codon:yes stop_codon:yes gene_type:complete
MPHDHHDHDTLSPSGHPYRKDDDTALSYWQVLEIAVRELLIEKGHITAVQVHDQINTMDARSPANGAKVVARAWCNPEFKSALLADAAQASRDMGFDIGPMHLIAVENTASVHNVVVCTLCSCYPRNLLGLPPDWYKSRAYRSRTVIEPRKVLSEFGVDIAQDVQVRVHDSTADMRYIVLPAQPALARGLLENELAQWVTRDSMIGVGIPQAPI